MKGRFLALAILLPFLAFSQMPYKQVTVAGAQQVVNLESVYSVIPSTTGKALLRMSGGSILQTDDDYLTFVQMNCATFIEVHATNWEYPTGYSTIGIGSKWVKDIKANGSGAFVTLKEPKNSYYTTESVSYFEPEYLAKICGGGGGGGGAQEFTHNQVAHGFVEGDLIYFSSGTTAKKAQSDVGLADSIAQWVVNDVVNADEFHYCNNCEITKVTGYTPGSYLWLSTTPGQFTNIQPTLTNCQYVGVVRTANSVYMHIGDICGQSAPYTGGADGNGIYDGSGTVPATMVAESANTSRATFQAETPSGNDGFTLKATDGTKTTYVTSYDDTEPFSVIANGDGTGLFLDGYTGGILQVASGQTMRVTDNNAVQFGLQYSADYSANLKNNARSIPDVGTVNTILTTLVPSMTAGSVVFSNGTILAQDNAEFFWDDTNNRLSIGSSVTSGAAQLSIRKDNIGVTQDNSYGIVLANNTAATAGNQQMSPGIRWRGNGWKTNATAGSQTVDFRADVLPVQGIATPSATWQLAYSINGNAYSNFFTISTTGSYSLGLPGLGAITNLSGFVKIDRYDLGVSRDGTNRNVVLSSNTAVAASGTVNFISTPFAVTPTSGTLVANAINVNGTINQTGGASGITRGLYIAPTLISAADWRAIETTAGSLVMGDTYLAGSGSLAGSLLNLTQTWNTTGTPTAIKLDVTDAASNSSSLLLDLQVGGVSKFKVQKTGSVTIADAMAVGAVNYYSWFGRSAMSSPSNGNIRLTNNAFNDFGLLQFGGVTSSFPAIKRNSAALYIRLADDSGYAGLSASYLNLDKTITAAGTTGNQTINKATGSVNFAAAATSLTVTNSLVTANSVIICTVATNDATMKSVAVRASAGSFVMYADAAPTAETQVNFIITN